MPRRFAVPFIVLACLQGACRDVSGPPVIDLTDGLGMAISDSRERVVGRPIWSPDGTEVYYFTSACTRVVYVLATGERRTLNDEAYTSPYAPYCDEDGVSVDSAHLYFVGRGEGLAQRLYRVARAGGPLELIDDSVKDALASPGGARIAYERAEPSCAGLCVPRDLWVYEVSSGSRRRLGTGHAVKFSPNGSELLVTQPSSTTAIISLADGTSRVVQPGLSEWSPSAVRWDATGIRELYATSETSAQMEFWMRNVTTGEARLVLARRPGCCGAIPSWSPDGTRFLFWIGVCHGYSYSWGCANSHEALYSADVATGRETWIAGGDGSYEGDAAYFSPDSKRIAYRFSPGDLRLTTMP